MEFEYRTRTGAVHARERRCHCYEEMKLATKGVPIQMEGPFDFSLALGCSGSLHKAGAMETGIIGLGTLEPARNGKVYP